MINRYKYKGLMAEKKVKEPCPSHNCREGNRKAYHFGFAGIENEHNFIPGHKRTPQRINDESDIRNCLYCGLSMFKTEAGARDTWDKRLPKRVRELLKYTHLLEGQLKEELGVMSLEAGEHFTFFEYEEVELREHFAVMAIL